MADTVEIGMTSGGHAAILVNGSEEFTALENFKARAPDAPAADLANALLFLAGDEYRLIADPEAFKEAYTARVQSEDPNQPWQENVLRLRDFGMPDFAEISAPASSGSQLTFFAEDRATGLPYRVEASIGEGPDPTFDPLALSPMPEPSPPVPEETGFSAVGPAPRPDPSKTFKF